MTKEEKEAVLHCLRAMIDEELCEECPLYGTTGTDHCEKDCVRLAIEELEQQPCDDATLKDIFCMGCEYKEQEPCDDCCNGNQIEKAKLCQKSYLAGMEHKQEQCADAISRQAVLDLVNADWKYEGLEEPINSLPPVNPQKAICPSAGVDPAYEKMLNKWIGAEVLDRIRNEMHATAEKHEDGVYYLRDEWVDEIIDKYAEGSDKE